MNTEVSPGLSGSIVVRGNLIGLMLFTFVLGGLLLSILFMNTRTALHITERHGRLNHIVTETKYESARFNLQLEKYLSGDSTLGRDKVWQHIKAAKIYTHAALYGGETAEGVVLPIDSPQLKKQVETVLSLLDKLEIVSNKRLSYSSEESIPGKISATTFSVLFKKLQQQLEMAEHTLSVIINEQKNRHTRFALFMGVLVFIGTILFAYLFYRYENQRIKNIQQIRDNEIRQRVILENMDDGVITINEMGIIETVNPAVESIFGYPGNEIIGSNLDVLIPEANAHTLDGFIENFQSDGKTNLNGNNRVVKGLRKYGSTFPLELSVSAIHFAGQHMYSSIVRDISKRIQAEEILEQFKYTLDNTLDCVFMFDANSLLFIYVNEGGVQQLGYTREELYALHSYDVKPDMPETQFREMLAPLRNGEKQSISFETVHRHKSGKRVAVEIFLQYITPKNGPARFVAIVREITERKEKEKALILSEQRLMESQQIAHLGHWDWNIVNGDINWSDENYHICGFEPGQITPSYEIFMDLIHPDDREEVKNTITQAMTKNDYSTYHRLLLSNNEIRYVHASGRTHYDVDGKPVRMIGTMQDITKQKLIEKEIEENRVRFRAMFQSIPDAIVYADPKRNIRMINRATTRIFGYEESELLGHLTKMLYASSRDFEKMGKRRFDLIPKNSTAPYELTYKRKNGKHFQAETVCTSVVSSDGEVLGYLGIVRDITERNQVNSIFKSLAASASSLDFEAFMSDFLQRLVEVYDCRFAFIARLTEDKQHAETIANYSNGESVANFTYPLQGTPCQDILTKQVQLIPKDVQNLYKDDEWLVELNIQGYFGTRLVALDGTVIGILSILDTKPLELDQWTEPVLDVFATRMSLELERDLAAKELLQHRENLEELVQERTAEMKAARDDSDKANQAKSEFLSRMSHELRTPMNAILGFGQLLYLDAEQLNETQRGNINEILEAGHHLLSLINEVLDLARVESGKLQINMEKVNIDDVMQQSLALIQPLATARHIGVTDHISGKGYLVQADSLRLKQILVNLLSNAVKYNQNKGHVTLDTDYIDKKRLRICITDTGAGLTKKDIEKLFTPFERLDKLHDVEGAGIGLVITKHLVELMGGSMGVESVPTEGSRFWIDLDIAV